MILRWIIFYRYKWVCRRETTKHDGNTVTSVSEMFTTLYSQENYYDILYVKVFQTVKQSTEE